MPVTVRELRDGHGRLLLGCHCGWQRYVALSAAPPELSARTVAELHAAERWICGSCARKPAAMVYTHSAGTMIQSERYPGWAG